MIDALVSGKLAKDPKPGISKNGAEYCSFLIAAHVGGEQPVLVSGISFGETAERMGKLRQGDSVSVVGSLKPSVWVDGKTGDERHGLNITVSACLTAYDVQKRRGSTNPKPGNAAAPRGEPTSGYDDGMEF